MATDPAVDPELLKRALEIGGEKTERATVNKALREFVARRERKSLVELFRTLDWDGCYSYKSERSR